MKEAFFILLIIGILFALTTFRYRKQIKTALGVWRMLKEARSSFGERQVEGSRQPAAGKLKNCAKCGTWVPEERSIRVPPNVYYCSRECLESFVNVG